MSLHDLAEKIRAKRLAAASAPATVSPLFPSTVAAVAAVAVAEPKTSKIEIVPQAPACADAERLKQATLAFRSSPFAEQAKALGWDEISLFGVHCGRP